MPLQQQKPVLFFLENVLSCLRCHHTRRSRRGTGTSYSLGLLLWLINTSRSPNCWLPAACFLKVQNTVEVALVLKIITRSRTRFAVRSGGHSANPGFGSVDAGILIDLSLVNDIVLSDDHEFVSVGPGAKWDEVYEELEKHELTVAGGRAAGVGVGGLITGGISINNDASVF